VTGIRDGRRRPPAATRPGRPRTLGCFAGACILGLGLGGCGRAQTSTAGTPASAAPANDGAASSAANPSSEQLETLWAQAKDGEPDELARLAHKEGALGLVERGANPAWRETAIRALAYADGWAGLPWLAEIADGANEKEATLAIETTNALAARPRRALDPEDATELRAGCDRLGAVAGRTQKAKAITVGASRTLQMLADRGCGTPAAPTTPTTPTTP